MEKEINKRSSAKIKQQVFERDAYTCQYCGKVLETHEATIDHVIPRSLGGEQNMGNLVTSCMKCNCLKANKELKSHLVDAIKSNTSYYQTFVDSMSNVNVLLNVNTQDDSIAQVFFRLLYSNVIASMETYLSDGFINTVINDPILIRRLVESDPEFKKRKFIMSDIYTCFEKIEETVRDYLLDIIYHNIWVVKNMYKCVLNIDFPEDMKEINDAIMIRHDIVHRNGREKKTGEMHILTKDILVKCINNMLEFVNIVDNQLKILDSKTLNQL